MNYRLLWKLCLIIATGTVALFYGIDWALEKAEESMSTLSTENKNELISWVNQAENLYNDGDINDLNQWLSYLAVTEDTWASIATADIYRHAGDSLEDNYLSGYNLGRNIDWGVHLFFIENPIIELPFENANMSLLMKLPSRMRPGSYWQTTKVVIQVIIPFLVLCLVSLILYKHIINPIRELKLASTLLSHGNFDVRVLQHLGTRDDEIAELAKTFDTMAERIGELVFSQRQLIADLSHELRTPLARLDIAIDSLEDEPGRQQPQLYRLQRESSQIRTLVEDALTFAWLDNERPNLKQEDLDLIDLIDVLIDDARYEFPDRQITTNLPSSALIQKTSHQALGQAIENILRNALRYTPSGEIVAVRLIEHQTLYQLVLLDQGPGVPENLLDTIFKPFFRVEKSRKNHFSETSALNTPQNFGLGLALARRQVEAIGGTITANNGLDGGLEMTITLAKNNS